VTLGIAEPGDIVGLPGTLSGNPCEATAEALEPLLAAFVPSKAFLQFLRDNGEAAVKAAEIASHLYQSTCQTVRYLVFCCSAEQKLACFLLHWAADRRQTGSQNPAAITLTHKEIAERIGASRETVTRLFSRFKRRRLVEIHHGAVVISSKAGLKNILPFIM
jgi:CRP-like cAMP-binding protein